MSSGLCCPIIRQVMIIVMHIKVIEIGEQIQCEASQHADTLKWILIWANNTINLFCYTEARAPHAIVASHSSDVENDNCLFVSSLSVCRFRDLIAVTVWSCWIINGCRNRWSGTIRWIGCCDWLFTYYIGSILISKNRIFPQYDFTVISQNQSHLICIHLNFQPNVMPIKKNKQKKKSVAEIRIE